MATKKKSAAVCAMCGKDAEFVYSLSAKHTTYYCGNDVPTFLQKKKELLTAVSWTTATKPSKFKENDLPLEPIVPPSDEVIGDELVESEE